MKLTLSDTPKKVFSRQGPYGNDDYLATHTASYDYNNDQFVGVQNHKVAKYFLGDIDKTSTCAGIVLYLEQNSAHPTAVKIFQCGCDNNLTDWINIPLNEIAIIESLDFPWPTSITFKPWFTKPQLYRETLKQSDKVFKGKPHLNNSKPNCHKDIFQKDQRNSRYIMKT